MELFTKTKAGNAVRLVIERDRHTVYQIYAYFVAASGAAEERYLCHGWGKRKNQGGMVEGILAQDQVIEISKSDWMTIFAAREDLRDKENLEDIRLVKIFSEGDQLTIDGHTLSARVDRETWRKIEPHMHFVDSSVNDILFAGDRFVGWVIKQGSEQEVERLLGVKPENSIQAEKDRSPS